MIIIHENMITYKSNTKYIIKSFRDECPIAYKNKLLSLGLLPGKVLEIKRKSLFGGPCQVSVRNADISIRVKELNLLELEEISS